MARSSGLPARLEMSHGQTASGAHGGFFGLPDAAK